MALGSSLGSDVTMAPNGSTGQLDQHEPNGNMVLEPSHVPVMGLDPGSPHGFQRQQELQTSE